MSCYRLYWSDPGSGSVSYVHLTTRAKRVLIAADYSSQLYGITVFQVLIASVRHFVVLFIHQHQP